MNAKRERKSQFISGIFLILIAVFFVGAAVVSAVRSARNAKAYPTAANGTVISCTVSTETDDNGQRQTYSNVVIRYDALNGEQNTIRRTRLPGAYQEGMTVALKCTEERNDAVLETETHQDPLFCVCMGFLALLFGLIGILFVSGKAMQENQ